MKASIYPTETFIFIIKKLSMNSPGALASVLVAPLLLDFFTFGILRSRLEFKQVARVIITSFS